MLIKEGVSLVKMEGLYIALLSLLIIRIAVGSDKPNIIILFADDLGYGDLAVYGHPTSTTPNLDLLAKQGLLFTQFYSANPVCSPSRAALMTGRYPPRTGIWPGVLVPSDVGGLPHNETTIAEALKQVGYKTGIVGKWHLGVGENGTYLPTNHGFDYYLGIPYSNDMGPCTVCYYPNAHCKSPLPNPCNNEYSGCPVFENDEIIQQPVDFTKLAEKYSNAATGFIRANAGKNPFFFYMAFSHTHKPQFAGEMFTNSSIRGHFGDALSELDWQVGEIMKTINEIGIHDNTFVFFTSDNGPSLHVQENGGNGGLLRCGKGSTWDGGMREPGIAWWPGKIRIGRTTELAATVDLFPTILKLSGANAPRNVVIDGIDMSPILFDNASSKRDHYVYFPSNYNPDTGYHAIRWKQYKAHYYTSGGLCLDTYPDVVCRANYSLHHHKPPLLYNLHEDASEVYNLDIKHYSDVMSSIEEVRKKFDSTFSWSESQMKRGKESNLIPCASPGCSLFPHCCKTSSEKWRDELWSTSSSAHMLKN